MSESFARAKSRWRGPEPPPHMYIVLYMHPNDITRGTNLWLILTDKKMETILLSNLIKNMILIKLMETILWKRGGSVGPLECMDPSG